MNRLRSLNRSLRVKRLKTILRRQRRFRPIHRKHSRLRLRILLSRSRIQNLNRRKQHLPVKAKHRTALRIREMFRRIHPAAVKPVGKVNPLAAAKQPQAAERPYRAAANQPQAAERQFPVAAKQRPAVESLYPAAVKQPPAAEKLFRVTAIRMKYLR